MNVAKRFFESKNMDINLVKIEGSVELAPGFGAGGCHCGY